MSVEELGHEVLGSHGDRQGFGLGPVLHIAMKEAKVSYLVAFSVDLIVEAVNNLELIVPRLWCLTHARAGKLRRLCSVLQLSFNWNGGRLWPLSKLVYCCCC